MVPAGTIFKYELFQGGSRHGWSFSSWKPMSPGIAHFENHPFFHQNKLAQHLRSWPRFQKVRAFPAGLVLASAQKCGDSLKTDGVGQQTSNGHFQIWEFPKSWAYPKIIQVTSIYFAWGKWQARSRFGVCLRILRCIERVDLKFVERFNEGWQCWNSSSHKCWKRERLIPEIWASGKRCPLLGNQ